MPSKLGGRFISLSCIFFTPVHLLLRAIWEILRVESPSKSALKISYAPCILTHETFALLHHWDMVAWNIAYQLLFNQKIQLCTSFSFNPFSIMNKDTTLYQSLHVGPTQIVRWIPARGGDPQVYKVYTCMTRGFQKIP